MRCLAATKLSLCLFAASILGSPTTLNAAENPKALPPMNLSVNAGLAPVDAADPEAAQSRVAQSYGDLPLSFEENRGQSDHLVRFLSRGAGYTFFLTPGEAVLAFSPDRAQSQAAVLRLQLAGSNADARITGTDPLPGSSNYFLGKDQAKWQTGVPNYRKVAYENIYPGINLVYYGNQRQLEYDFVVAPGADPRMIRLAVAGAGTLTVDGQGNLVLGTAGEIVRLLAPRIYQDIDGRRQEIAGQWNIDGNNTAGFRLAAYDHSRALVIDPVLVYSSFLGGSQKNSLSRIAIDAAGNAYVAGFTASGDFPAAPTPQATTFGGGSAQRGVFVAKIDPTGSTLLYSTYLSGSAGEQATGLALDSSGNAYVTGNTTSTDFPVRNAFQSACATNPSTGACSNAFLTKINSTGDALLYSTYLGGTGTDSATSLAVDSQSNAYVVGMTSSRDFPATTGVLQTKCGGACVQNAFLAKFNASGESLAYATFLGGSGSDGASDVALDSAGNAYVTGQTTSADFPLANPFQKTCTVNSTSQAAACLATAFVAKIKPDGSALAYSTYLGGNLGSHGTGIAVDSLGSAYVTGSTQSADFPTLKAFQSKCGLDAASGKCSVDAFLSKLTPDGKALVYSTYLGGSGSDEATGIALDAAGNAHIVGSTESPDFPTAKPLQSHLNGASDAFLAKFNATGSALLFSTYHGGGSTEAGNSIAIDARGNIYVAGETSSPDFPTSHPFQSSCAGACNNAFVSKMAALPPGAPASITPNAGTTPQSVVVNATFTNALAATVLDSGSSPVSGVVVTFTAPSTTTAASGTFLDSGTNTTTATTDVNGVATPAAFTANPYAGGPYTVTATVSGLTANFKLTNTAGTVKTVTPVGGTTPQSAIVNAAFANALAVTVVDAGGKPLGGLTVTFTAPSTTTAASGTFADSGTSTTTAITDITGLATAAVFTANPFAGGPYTVTGATGGKTGNFTLTNTAGAVKTVTPVAGTTPQSAVVNTAFANPLAVTVVDAGGKPLGGLTVTFTAPASGASGTFADSGTNTTTAITDMTGVATAAAFTANSSMGGPYTVTGTTAGKTGNFSLTNTAGTVKTVTPAAGTTPQSAVVNNAFAKQLSVTVLDGSNKPLSGLTVTFTAPNTTTAASGTFADSGTNTTTASTDASGVATAAIFTANPFAGAYTVTATTGGKTGNFSLTNTAGTVNTVTPVAGTTPQSAVVNNAFANNLAVTVLDGGGKPLGGLIVTFTAPNTTTAASGNFADSGTSTTTATTDINGLATAAVFTANSFAGGPYTVTGATGGKSGSFSLTNTAGTVATVTASSGTPQSAVVNTAFAKLSVTVLDGKGKPLGGLTVTFTAPTTAGPTCTFAGSNTATPATDITGVASAICTANTVAGGPYTVTGATSGLTANFSLTNLPGPPATITPAPGSTPQNVPVTNTFASALSGTVKDQYQNTVLQGINVTLTAPAGSAANGVVSGTFSDSGTNATTAQTNSSGVFTAAAFTANINPGPYNVAAATTTGTATLNYSLTNTDFTLLQTPPTSTIFIQGQNAPISTSAPPMVTVTEQFGYSGSVTLNCVAGSLPSGAACAAITPPKPTFVSGIPTNVTSAVTINTSPSTPVGAYTVMVTGTDNSPNPVINSASFTLSVECNYSLGNTGTSGTVPTYAPLSTSAPYTLFVTETAGGSNCPWGPSPDAMAPPAVTSTSGVTVVTGSTGQVSAVNTGSPVTYDVTAISSTAASPQLDQITVSYFQAGSSNNVGTSILNVTQEVPVQLTAGIGTTAVNLPATQVGTGTLTIPNASGLAVTTVCAAANASGPDITGNNFDLTCTAQVTGSTVQLSVTVSAATPALQADRGVELLYSAGLGMPAIVFLGLGASAFGPKRNRLALRRITSLLGLLLLISLLVLLPACGGGFHANFGGNQTATYTLTVMGYVTDSNTNNVTGVEIFAVPLNIVK